MQSICIPVDESYPYLSQHRIIISQILKILGQLCRDGIGVKLSPMLMLRGGAYMLKSL